MGLFSKPTDEPAPLSVERVAARMDAQGYRYQIDDDGDLGGYWDGHLFYFFVQGASKEILQVRGRWQRHVPAESRTSALDVVNDWNTEKLWPKGYVRLEDGELGVYGEVTVDYEHGVTDAQLDQQILCGVSTTIQMFELLDQVFPEAAAAAAADDAN
jgi:hypothetical protein